LGAFAQRHANARRNDNRKSSTSTTTTTTTTTSTMTMTMNNNNKKWQCIFFCVPKRAPLLVDRFQNQQDDHANTHENLFFLRV
jgi:hypothetical protein